MKLLPIIGLVFYLYSIIGMYYFNTVLQNYRVSEVYSVYSYTNFNSMSNSLLLLFQVMIESNWPDLVYDYGYKFDNLVGSVFYFSSWYLLI